MMAGETTSDIGAGGNIATSSHHNQMTIDTQEGTKTMKTIVSVKGLDKRYQLGKDNYVDALRGASVNVGAGEMVAIMGPSGCGKSTMLHMMGCLDEPDSGEVWLNGRRVDSLSTRATTKLLREEIGFIFQGFNLVSTMTALDNVALAAQYAGKSRREAQKLAREALEAVGLADRAGHRPSELSGGQQQRVAIARALVNRPAVIMGDEPTGNLDTTSSAEVIDMMRQINLLTGTTFILVTHDSDVAAACDRVIHMRDGVVTDDTSRLVVTPIGAAAARRDFAEVA
jgi:putative ABC transport system ATP-binding protein